MIIVKLINLLTGEVREVDFHKLREQGIPENFEVAEELSTVDWVKALQRALGTNKSGANDEC